MKQLIVPIDFSEYSVRAFQKAIYMARQVNASISLLHVNKVKAFPSFFSNTKSSADEANLEKNLQELIQNTPHEGIDVNYVLRRGTVSKEIVKFAEEINAFLIIMGTHGASGFEEFWMGSNAYRAVTSAPCPVLTTRGLYSQRPIKKIVLPLDTTSTTRQKVPFAVELAKMFKAEIHVVAVCVDETHEFVVKLTNYTAQVVRHLNKEGIENVHDFINGDNPTDMTIEYAKKVDADLICIMTEQETSIVNHFLGAYAQQMVNHSPVPVVTIHKNPDLEGDVTII